MYLSFVISASHLNRNIDSADIPNTVDDDDESGALKLSFGDIGNIAKLTGSVIGLVQNLIPSGNATRRELNELPSRRDDNIDESDALSLSPLVHLGSDLIGVLGNLFGGYAPCDATIG